MGITQDNLVKPLDGINIMREELYFPRQIRILKLGGLRYKLGQVVSKPFSALTQYQHISLISVSTTSVHKADKSQTSPFTIYILSCLIGSPQDLMWGKASSAAMAVRAGKFKGGTRSIQLFMALERLFESVFISFQRGAGVEMIHIVRWGIINPLACRWRDPVFPNYHRG